MRTVAKRVTYTRESTGEEVATVIQISVPETVAEDIATNGEAAVLRGRVQQITEDRGNAAREALKVANGDSKRVPMTPEGKLKAKAMRDVAKMIAGQSADDLRALGVPEATITALGL